MTMLRHAMTAACALLVAAPLSAQAQMIAPALIAASSVAKAIGIQKGPGDHDLRRREDLHVDDKEARKMFKRMQREQRRLLNRGDRGGRVKAIRPDSRRY